MRIFCARQDPEIWRNFNSTWKKKVFASKKISHKLNFEVDVNTVNTNGLSALHLASKEGHQMIVSELLSLKVDVNKELLY